MNAFIALTVAALAAGTADTPDQPQVAPVRVVTTLPVYASITRAVGGDEVEVVSIADPNEDSHFVRPKPSYALEIRRADMFVTTGLDLELWVPALLDKAGNGDVMEGAQGYVTAHTGIELLDIPTAADRSQGDIHIYGNPHLHTDPLRALQVARNITTGLKRVAPDRASVFDAGLAAYQAETYEHLFGARLVELLEGPTLERLALNGNLFSFLRANEYEGTPLIEHLGGWLEQAMPLRGARMICYHVNWSYFEERFGVDCTAYVETKPGISPTPRHVARLIDLMRTQDLSVVFAANYFDPGRVENVARRGDAQAVIVPMQTNPRAGIDSYFDLVDVWVTELVDAMSSGE
ncbi:MAG: metal ABC transporter substrate-binding protein [Longimicrobiales bacterium]|nr:metal ABC transporter substrate-binding protein [Longimicrobiales bacterium]